MTLVCPGIHGAFADEQHPLAAQGPWLQVYLSTVIITKMLTDLSVLQDTKVHYNDDYIITVSMLLIQMDQRLPITFTWPGLAASISVHNNLVGQ